MSREPDLIERVAEAMALFEGRTQVRELDRQRALKACQLVQTALEDRAKEWEDVAVALWSEASRDRLNYVEYRARAESYEECAEELRKLLEES